MKNLTLLIASLGLAVAGCAGDPKKDSDSGAATTGGSSLETSGSQGGASTDATREAPAEPKKPQIDISKRIVYFEFDSSAIKASALETVSRHAKYLSQNPNTRVRLEGHADERGTREYNVALGERRANAVRDALLLRGVSARQISVVSYGEERPAVMGHNENAWSQNRRVEFVY